MDTNEIPLAQIRRPELAYGNSATSSINQVSHNRHMNVGDTVIGTGKDTPPQTEQQQHYYTELDHDSFISTGSTGDSSDEEPSDGSGANVAEDYPDGGIQAYLVLLGSFLGLTANFGCTNSVGAIQTYLANHQLADESASVISWIFSIYQALALTFTIFVGPYFDAKGSLRPMIAGNVLVFCGLIATANCTEVWQFILALSICVGLGHSLCITPLIGVISHWFYIHIGLAIGISSIGGSVGGIAIPLMLRNLYVKLGFPWAIRILAFFCLGLNTMATILIKERFTEAPADSSATRIVSSKRRKIVEAGKKFFDYSAIKDAKFVFLTLGVLCGEISLLSLITYYGTFAMAQGMSESQSYILLTIFNAMGVLGRSCPGYFSDKIGHFNMMILMISGSTLSILLLMLPFGSNHVILYVFILFYGFTSSLILSLTPACLRQITPVKVFGSRYGLMYFFVSLGNLFGIPVGSAIIGDSSRFHYKMFSLFCGLVALLSSFFWICSRYKKVGFTLNAKI